MNIFQKCLDLTLISHIWIISYMDKTQIYVAESKVLKKYVVKEIFKFLKTIEGVKKVFAPEYTEFNSYYNSIDSFIKNSYHPKESRDIFYHMYPGYGRKKIWDYTWHCL